MHFYCSNHATVFCRECIKEEHTEERCFVVDLYEIEKMRKLQSMNNSQNKDQLKKRTDEGQEGCVIVETFQAIVDKKKLAQKEKRVIMGGYLAGY